MEQNYIDDSFCDICPLLIKKYFDFNEIRSIFSDFIPSLSYRTRGFYFVPLKTSYSKILYLFKESDYKKVKELSKKFEIICSSLCSKISSINERLENIEAKEDS